MISRPLASSQTLAVGVLGVGLIVVAASFVWAKLASDGASEPDFWHQLRFEVPEVSSFSTLSEMLDASDAVVVARVGGVGVSRTIQGDVTEDVVAYIGVELEVERVIAGDAPTVVPLEFLFAATPDSVAAHVEALRRAIPVSSSVFFLHEKQGPGERGLYRLTNSRGLWTSTSRAEVDTPLREISPEMSGLFADELRGVQTMDDLIVLLADIAGPSTGSRLLQANRATTGHHRTAISALRVQVVDMSRAFQRSR